MGRPKGSKNKPKPSGDTTTSALSLKEGDILTVTIKSDELDETTLKTTLDSFKDLFPNNKVCVMGVGQNDAVHFSVTSEGSL